MDPSPEERKPEGRKLGDARAKSQGKLALALGLIAVALSLGFGIACLISVGRLERRLDGQVARLNQQMEDFGRVITRSQEQSQASAQQASQAAANALAAAQQRDLAKQDQSTAEAQAQLAQQQAAAEQQKANEAIQQAEQYRKEREAQLAQIQKALGQIAETRRTANGVVMTLDSKSIRFDFDKADIKPEYRDILNRIAGVLMTLKGYSIAIYGYTDSVGTPSYNLQLSQRRAEAVRNFFEQAGISASIMSTKGFGSSDPRVPGESELARAANRRVEIAIIDSKLITNRPLVVPE
ncbi:MAG TPA: OmpA family protein [Terriglobales bacterium]|nr:OmpA family protein [Terriglobales bacterium]